MSFLAPIKEYTVPQNCLGVSKPLPAHIRLSTWSGLGLVRRLSVLVEVYKSSSYSQTSHTLKSSILITTVHGFRYSISICFKGSNGSASHLHDEREIHPQEFEYSPLWAWKIFIVWTLKVWKCDSQLTWSGVNAVFSQILFTLWLYFLIGNKEWSWIID